MLNYFTTLTLPFGIMPTKWQSIIPNVYNPVHFTDVDKKSKTYECWTLFKKYIYIFLSEPISFLWPKCSLQLGRTRMFYLIILWQNVLPQFQTLTRVSNRNPVVELIVVGHRVELTAQHLSEGWFVVLTRFGVAGLITLPLSSTILASKLWSVRKRRQLLEITSNNVWGVFVWILTLGCCTLCLQTALQFHRSWSSETICSTGPSLRSPSRGVFPHLHTLQRYTTYWGNKLKTIMINEMYWIRVLISCRDGTDYLFRTTASTVDGRVQFGATGSVHGTPENLANVLKGTVNNEEGVFSAGGPTLRNPPLCVTPSHRSRGRRWRSARTGADTDGVWCNERRDEPAGWLGLF